MNETGKKKHVIREPPSVPFIWEIKPGIPKKDWKPEMCSVSQFPKTPLKLIASVPFVWEEKPGTPLPNFSHVSIHDPVPPRPEKEKILIHVASSSGFSVPCSFGHDDKLKGSYNVDTESITSLDLEAFSFDSNELSSSVPSLLANCLVSSAKVSTATPLENNSFWKDHSGKMETPSSPTSSETESSTSSYETGRSSLIGATFLECLFPLYPPKSGLLERDHEHLENVTSSTQDLRAQYFDHEDCASDLVRRPPTLGELIMMSRRRSCRRKAVQMKKWDPPKKITGKQGFGCFSIVTNRNMIEGLLKKKYFPGLKTV